MMLTVKPMDAVRPWTIIIATALAAQLVGRYSAGSVLVAGEYFYGMWPLLRIVLPLAVLVALRVPLGEMGLGRPRIDRGTGRMLVAAAVLLCLGVAAIYFYQGYYGS
jgi:hypothetical protein